MNIFKNKEIKYYLLKLSIIGVLFSIFIFLYTNVSLELLNQNITDNNIAIISKILSNHPELKDEIPSYFTKEVSREDFLNSKKIMQQYGYGKDLEIENQPVLNTFYKHFPKIILKMTLALMLFLMLLAIYEYYKFYKKIRNISKAAEKVVEGDFSYLLPMDMEGDLGLLYSNFNHMGHRLKFSLQTLKQDKIFLKNIISDISHQLKTPLASLIMFNDIMVTNEDLEKDVVNDFLEKSNSQLDRMQFLIINLLKMTRLEAGVIKFKKTETPLILPVQHTLDSLEVMANEKNQSIKITEKNKNVTFIGDGEWLSEALTNIIKNCIEHTPENGSIDIVLSESPLLSQIVIKDTGEGIPKKDLPHIFKRFYASSSSTKANSIGIGLSLAKLIVENQNGTIFVNSIEGEGTKFTITFLKTII